MPQMSLLWWLTLMITMNMVFMMINKMVYFKIFLMNMEKNY